MNANRRTFGIVLGTVLIATAALGQIDEFYGKADIGPNFLQDVTINDDTLEANPGFRVSLGGGWKLNELAALELETGFIHNNFDDEFDTWLGTVPLLASVTARYENRTHFVPYAGLGGGAAITILGDEFDTDTDVVFAWQAELGVMYKLSDRLTADFKYKFFSPMEQDYEIGNDTFTLDDVYNHFLGVGLTYRF